MHMGIFGAVLATGFAPVINLLILSLHFTCRRNGFRLMPMPPSLKVMAAALPLGVPSFITEFSSGIVIFVFNFIILKLQGNVGVAAYGVIANLSLVISAIFTGIAEGMQPLASHTYGCNDAQNTRRLLRYALTTMLAIAAVVYLTVFLFADPITAIFNSENNPQLQAIAVLGLKLYFIATPFVGFNIIMSVYFAATEKAAPAQLISLLRGLFIIIPMSFLLSALWGITGVWLTFPVTEIVVTGLGGWIYIADRKRQN